MDGRREAAQCLGKRGHLKLVVAIASGRREHHTLPPAADSSVRTSVGKRSRRCSLLLGNAFPGYRHNDHTSNLGRRRRIRARRLSQELKQQIAHQDPPGLAQGCASPPLERVISSREIL